MTKTQIDSLIHMGQRIPNSQFEHSWKPIDIQDFTPILNKKTIFIFGGNTTNYPEAANGNAKIVEKLLDMENKNKVDIFSFLYDKEPISSHSKLLLSEYEDEINQIYYTIFEPMFLDNSGNIKEKQGVEKVLKNMIFVSHCGGSDFVNIIIDRIYNLLLEKYHPSVALQLISKFQYLSYAPYSLPNKDVKSFIISPCFDINASWSKVLSDIEEEKIYTEFPKNAIKRLLKAQENDNILGMFNTLYTQQRIIVARTGSNIYLIPNRLNPDTLVGDHSIDCLVKKKYLESNCDCANTARVLNVAIKIMLNQLIRDSSIDHKEILVQILEEIKNNPPASVNNNFSNLI